MNDDSGKLCGSIRTTDAFSNPTFQLGYATQNPLEATEYPMTRLTQNYTLLNSLYRSNWIVQNIICTIPEDITKKWFRVKCNMPPGAIDRLSQVQRITHLRQSILEGLKWGRLYGGAAGIILIKGQEQQLDTPLNTELILPDSFAGLYIVDRWSGISPGEKLVTDISNPDFGSPELYQLHDDMNRIVQNVHHSRVIRFTGRELPHWEKITELYWGESEIEAVYSEIVKRDNVSANMASLTFKANVNYMESDGLDQMLATSSAETQRRFWRTMQAQAVLESNFGMRVVNKGDTMHNTQYTFSGLSDVYSAVMMDVAGAARIPITKLFGRSPAGLNATGESDLQNYYDYIDELRESTLRPIIERILPVLALSSWGTIPEDLSIEFEPIQTPDAPELANIALKKTQSIIQALQAGLLDMSQAQKELKGLSDATGMYGSITDESIVSNVGKTYQEATAMRDPFSGIR